MSTVSVVVPTYDEELNIRACLETVKWADEIIIVDMFSADRTLEIAREYTDRIFRQKGNHRIRDIQANINLGIAKANGDWILRLDADERVTPGLCEEILEKIHNDDPSIAAYRLSFRFYFAGRWMDHGMWAKGKIVRLFRRGAAHYQGEALVHETFEVHGQIADLEHRALHYGHPSIEKLDEKHNRYTTAEAQALRSRGEPFELHHLFVRPVKAFLSWYILNQGYKDGLHGFLAAVFWAFYHFQIHAKLFELEFKAHNRDDGQFG